MGIDLIRWNESENGALSGDAMRRRMEGLGCTVTQYTYPPGAVFPPHTHDVDKIDDVLSGHFRMTMLGETVILEAGEMLAVPRNTPHSAEVVGDDARHLARWRQTILNLFCLYDDLG
ncbi:MAG TPA: cupin domain-containing protein [Mariprofundaceae bacterium]|nr:cupin domain-containing protein [Mariprofundaceae bacterium]